MTDSTTDCPACGGLVSLAAPACPHCGHPMELAASKGGPPARPSTATPQETPSEDLDWRMSHVYFIWRYALAGVLPMLPMLWNLFLGGSAESAPEGAELAGDAAAAVSTGMSIPAPYFSYISLTLLAASLVLLLIALVQRLGTRYSLTADGYVREVHGLLSRRTAELHVSDIRLVNLNQSIWQRIFGIGCIDISSAGNAGIEVRFVGIPDAEAAKERILTRAETSDD